GGVEWDLPHLERLIAGAQRRVRVQLLTYRTVGYDRTYFGRLEAALRSAAARGVHVELLLADWSKRRWTIEGLQSLQVLPRVEVKLMAIPEWSGGFIPYARVSHAKYMVADGRAAWIGTSNWEKGYFFESRNVGLILEGETFCSRLDEYFAEGWSSSYAEAVDPCAAYEPPRIGE
ncbi:MAG: phospholipase, partial [Candidatus Eisenbacteria bacterium]|nr:phospholipase [Candidatus Eisenbacteria bacterium]